MLAITDMDSKHTNIDDLVTNNIRSITAIPEISSAAPSRPTWRRRHRPCADGCAHGELGAEADDAPRTSGLRRVAEPGAPLSSGRIDARIGEMLKPTEDLVIKHVANVELQLEDIKSNPKADHGGYQTGVLAQILADATNLISELEECRHWINNTIDNIMDDAIPKQCKELSVQYAK